MNEKINYIYKLFTKTLIQEMSILSKTYIDKVESVISSGILYGNGLRELLPCFSFTDIDNILPSYNKINNSPINSYEQFASNGMGMTSYGFYKANNENIYIIVAYINEIIRVYSINDTTTLTKLNVNKKI